MTLEKWKVSPGAKKLRRLYIMSTDAGRSFVNVRNNFWDSDAHPRTPLFTVTEIQLNEKTLFTATEIQLNEKSTSIRKFPVCPTLPCPAALNEDRALLITVP
jgi:hypothetical protein